MAPTKRRNVVPPNSPESGVKAVQMDLESVVNRVLVSKNDPEGVFAILEGLVSDKEDDVVSAIEAFSKLFSALLKRKELFVGKLPEEELRGDYSDKHNFPIFLRHLYNNCVEILSEHLDHEVFQVKERALACLMKFASEEGNYPLEDVSSEFYSLPLKFIQIVVDRLLSQSTANVLLISSFKEYLKMDDVRYDAMRSICINVAKVMDPNNQVVLPMYQANTFALMSSIGMPGQESELTNFMVKQGANPEARNLLNHKRCFEQMWLGFLKHKLHRSMYKKVLAILHKSVLPHMIKPTLMQAFLTSAYEVGGAVSLLALHGIFILMLHHNLEYPDFYNKLYYLFDPSVFNVKYKADFFRLANIFLSTSHLPVYLVAAFAKRLARLALEAPTLDILIVLPFIYNLIRRYPSCNVLIQKSKIDDEAGPIEDPYLMEENNPALCRALESSLWEIKTLQSHYYPDVVKSAMLINNPLPEQEEDINKKLGMTVLMLIERDLEAIQMTNVPMNCEKPTGFFKGEDDILGQLFELK